jgi:ribosomal-protein-alanine N-acetyltransferase
MRREDVEIRMAHLTDVDAVVALEQATNDAPHWPREEYVRIIECGAGGTVRRLLAVAAAGGRVVGFAVGKVIGGEPDAVSELESIAVTEDARRLGVGRALLTKTARWCTDQGASAMELEVRSRNEAARAFYKEAGFVEAGVRKGYYRDPADDAVLMNRQALKG